MSDRVFSGRDVTEALGTAAQALGLPPERTNVNGGAIAMGHPLGASGARITTHLLYELPRRKVRWGAGAACIGGGQGIAVILESLL